MHVPRKMAKASQIQERNEHVKQKFKSRWAPYLQAEDFGTVKTLNFLWIVELQCKFLTEIDTEQLKQNQDF